MLEYATGSLLKSCRVQCLNAMQCSEHTNAATPTSAEQGRPQCCFRAAKDSLDETALAGLGRLAALDVHAEGRLEVLGGPGCCYHVSVCQRCFLRHGYRWELTAHGGVLGLCDDQQSERNVETQSTGRTADSRGSWSIRARPATTALRQERQQPAGPRTAYLNDVRALGLAVVLVGPSRPSRLRVNFLQPRNQPTTLSIQVALRFSEARRGVPHGATRPCRKRRRWLRPCSGWCRRSWHLRTIRCQVSSKLSTPADGKTHWRWRCRKQSCCHG